MDIIQHYISRTYNISALQNLKQGKLDKTYLENFQNHTCFKIFKLKI